MRALMHDLGDPQAQVSFVHIAGTSGKGSTAAFTESILRACGYRTGLFLSPHVYDFRERIQLGGEMASPELLAQVFTEMRPALDRFDAAGDPCMGSMPGCCICIMGGCVCCAAMGCCVKAPGRG